MLKLPLIEPSAGRSHHLRRSRSPRHVDGGSPTVRRRRSPPCFASEFAPVRPTDDGKIRPSHCRPRTRVDVAAHWSRLAGEVDRASTMRASIEICGVWVSSWSASFAIWIAVARDVVDDQRVRAVVDLDVTLGDSMPSNLVFISRRARS